MILIHKSALNILKFKFLFKIVLLLACTMYGSNTIAQVTPLWQFATKDASFGQSAAADLDHDGKLEIVFSCYRNDSMIYVLNAENGSLLWKYNTGTAFSEGCSDAAPLIYDIDADGQLEVILASSCNPKTFCFNGKTGALKWVCATRGSDSPPSIADIDADGKLEILHGEFGGYVIAINALDGTKKWEIAVDTNSWIQTAPSILDINNDGDLDFIVATWNAVQRDSNKVYAIRGKDKKILWTFPLSDVVYHGTAIGDIDHDGVPEAIIGCYNDTLYCLNANTGKLKWKFSFGNYYYVGSPAIIADINNDKDCEIIFSAYNKIGALSSKGVLLWSYTMPNYGQSFRGPALADINNNSYPDVIFGTDAGQLIALNGQDGSLILNHNLRKVYGDSLFKLEHAPLIADFNNDSKLDAFIVGGHAEYPLFNKNFGAAYLISLSKGNGPDWLMFQNNNLRNSSICSNSTSAIQSLSSFKNQLECYPNPITDQARFQFQITENTHVQLILSNPQGISTEMICNKNFNPGNYTLNWYRPQSLASGLYYLYFKTDKQNTVYKIVLE